MSLRVTFLGTGGAVPTTERAPSAIHVNREGDQWLFDCGEGTQRQMMRYGTGFAISNLFVTHLHGDHILGVPGLVQSLDFNGRNAPLVVHTPAGTGQHIDNLVRAGGYQPGFRVQVEEVTPGDVALDADDYRVLAFATQHRTKSVGYALVEDDRRGRFDRERAEELGVPVGPKFSELHAGNPVELDDGRTIHPEQVVGEPRPGRRVVYTGDTRPCDSVVDAADGADLLVHDATFASDESDRARATGHSTAREAARIADEAGVKRLGLTHVSSRYAGDSSPLASEARRNFDGESFVAHDGQTVDVPFPEEG